MCSIPEWYLIGSLSDLRGALLWIPINNGLPRLKQFTECMFNIVSLILLIKNLIISVQV